MLNTIKYPGKKDWPVLLQRPLFDNAALVKNVSAILEEVKRSGDAALKKLTASFDGYVTEKFEVSPEEFKNAGSGIDPELKRAISLAAKNIEKFHKAQREKNSVVETAPGVKCWRRSVPVEKVGLYVPGGSAPLFSTLLMLGIPAKLAGCREIIVCTPPGKNGKADPVILYVAKKLGITKVFKLGGAQAIAAMAYGTESVPQVYKLFGPGNQYVTCAKQLVNSSGAAIDMPAGPSELAVFADESSVPSFVAADLLSQAEHGPDSQVLLVSCNEQVIGAVKLELQKQLDRLPRKETAIKALLNSRAIVAKNREEAMELLNAYAPEHLILACRNSKALAGRVLNAGSVFLGNYSCESAGDYASGTNHTLPTNAAARAYSGVSLDSFVKKITFQQLSEKGIRKLGPAIMRMAEAEGLEAHKSAVAVRINKNKK